MRSMPENRHPAQSAFVCVQRPACREVSSYIYPVICFHMWTQWKEVP